MTNEEIVKKIEALEKEVEKLKAYSPAAHLEPFAHLFGPPEDE